jgi:uncharacterized Fe-S center protein
LKKDAAFSKVFFAGMRSRKPGDNKAGKIKKLFRAAGFADILSEGGA